jgi:hypothetical protein
METVTGLEVELLELHVWLERSKITPTVMTRHFHPQIHALQRLVTLQPLIIVVLKLNNVASLRFQHRTDFSVKQVILW